MNPDVLAWMAYIYIHSRKRANQDDSDGLGQDLNLATRWHHGTLRSLLLNQDHILVPIFPSSAVRSLDVH